MKSFNKFSFLSIPVIKKLLLILPVFFALMLYGCVNVDQKTKINDDGSGSITLHYWTKNSNLSMSDEIGGFGFSEDKARTNYTSANSEVKSVNLSTNDEDSTTHVKMEVDFKDFNKLNEAAGFNKIKSSWQKGDDGYDFNYTLLQDTANASGFGMNEYKLVYEFEFPAEVASTNGNKNGSSVKWEKTVADLQNDVEMTATIKSGGKKCGLFGLELPIVFLLGMTFLYSKKLRRRK
jgi:hypothetical protein